MQRYEKNILIRTILENYSVNLQYDIEYLASRLDKMKEKVIFS